MALLPLVESHFNLKHSPVFATPFLGGKAMNILTAVMEVGIAFVGFSTIVVVIQMSLGGSLTSFQVLLTHFYIETGLLTVGLAGLPVAL